MELDELWETLISMSIATEDELQLVTNIAGYSVETLNAVLYSRTGSHDIEQFLGEI